MARPGARKMDLVLFTAGIGRAPLCIDFCRCFGATRGALEAAENAKVRKYQNDYSIPVTLRGFAYDELGRTGPQADEVVSLLVCAGVRAGAGHPCDLANELWANFSCALARATASRMAYFAEINRDHTAYAPRPREVTGGGRSHVLGASYRLIGPQRRAAPRPYSIAVTRAPRVRHVAPRRPAAPRRAAPASPVDSSAAAGRPAAPPPPPCFPPASPRTGSTSADECGVCDS